MKYCKFCGRETPKVFLAKTASVEIKKRTRNNKQSLKLKTQFLGSKSANLRRVVFSFNLVVMASLSSGTSDRVTLTKTTDINLEIGVRFRVTVRVRLNLERKAANEKGSLPILSGKYRSSLWWLCKHQSSSIYN